MPLNNSPQSTERESRQKMRELRRNENIEKQIIDTHNKNRKFIYVNIGLEILFLIFMCMTIYVIINIMYIIIFFVYGLY